MRHDDDAFEDLLRRALRRAGEPAPFPVDVTERVMKRVGAVGPAPRSEIGRAEWIRWACAALLAGAALLAAASFQAPSLAEVVHGLGRTTAQTAGAAAKLASPAETVAGAGARTGMILFETVRSVSRPLSLLTPFAGTILTAIAAVMIGITTFVVGRDLRAPAPIKE